MTPTQPSLLDTPKEAKIKPVQRGKDQRAVTTAKPRKSKPVAPRCASCATYLMPHDRTGLDGKRYCRPCWASVPDWLRGMVPMAEWPKGWRQITGAPRVRKEKA